MMNSTTLLIPSHRASVGPQVKAVLLGLLGLLEAEVLLDPQGLMETRVNLVLLVLWALLVHLVLVDSQERGVLLAYLEAREKRYSRRWALTHTVDEL